MKQAASIVVAILLTLGALPASAHFQELLPSSNIIEGKSQRNVSISAVFTHPMEGGPVMNMGQPVKFGVIGREGQVVDLLSTLRRAPINGKQAFAAEYKVPGPANYIFFMEPAPYWERQEGKMLIHYTKVVVNALGADEGWDQMTGAPIEIKPLTRPYGLWAGNIFSGVVYYNGKPLPNARIEVEYVSNGKVKLPADAYVNAVVKSDSTGYFAYAMPKAGWWGFSAIVTGVRKMQSPEGTEVPVEEGGLIWVKTMDMR